MCCAGGSYEWQPELLGPQCALFARKFPQPTAEPMLWVRLTKREAAAKSLSCAWSGCRVIPATSQLSWQCVLVRHSSTTFLQCKEQNGSAACDGPAIHHSV
jgi:hypothetical protein